MAERITHGIDLITQLVASVFADEEQSPAVIRGEQGKAQAAVEAEQALVLITREEGSQHAFHKDDSHSQQAEVERSLTPSLSVQQEIEHGEQYRQAGKVE